MFQVQKVQKGYFAPFAPGARSAAPFIRAALALAPVVEKGALASNSRREAQAESRRDPPRFARYPFFAVGCLDVERSISAQPSLISNGFLL
jgi:hypothetical protein